MTETYRQCLGCKLHHKPSMACSVARRLNASGLLPQPDEICVSTQIKSAIAGALANKIDREFMLANAAQEETIQLVKAISEADKPENGGPLTIRKPVEYASVNTSKAPKTTDQGVNKDRHSKDYMKAYMAKYRAEKKAKAK